MFLHVTLGFLAFFSFLFHLGVTPKAASVVPTRIVDVGTSGMTFRTDSSVPVPTTMKPSPVRVPILMYHYVEVVHDLKDTIRIGLDILPKTLDAQIATLLSHGYTPIFMDELGMYLDGKGLLPDKPIVLTFDDGYRDFYTDAYPILQKYHVKATNYIVPGFLDKPNYMTTVQVQDAAKSGIVEVGAHTVHHYNLKHMAEPRLVSEVALSKAELEKIINKPVTDFAYPYGAFDAAAISVVSQAGFRTAVSTLPGVMQSSVNRFTLRRVRPGGRVGDALIALIESIKN